MKMKYFINHEMYNSLLKKKKKKKKKEKKEMYNTNVYQTY